MVQKNIGAVINRVAIVIGCAVLISYTGMDLFKLGIILVLICIGGLGIYIEQCGYISWMIAVYAVGSVFFREMIYGMPIILYECCDMVWNLLDRKKVEEPLNRQNTGAAMLDAFAVLILVVSSVQYFIELNNGYITAIEVIQMVVAVLMNWYNNNNIRLNQRLIELRDNSQELNMALRAKNQYLIEKQDSQIYTATLQERNRIAREIHDNVGHMLSRSLLQTGAAIAVNRQENLTSLLKGIKDTLDCAMNNIRSSVHDLHDESIDLDRAIRDVLEQMNKYKIAYEYDITEDVPREVKYCVISIIKEASANVMNHSDADSVDIVLREHPAFYQLLIRDNGHCVKQGDGTGIGIENMKERVAGLNGTINFNTEKGYKIFICIPKTKMEENGDNKR